MDTPLNPTTSQMSQNVPECPTGAHSFADSNAQEAPPEALNERQRRALELILVGQDDIEIAKKLDIDRRTLYRWRHDQGPFAAELQKRRQQLWDGVVDRLRNMLVPSLNVLNEHLADSLDRNRYRAAVSILRLSDVRKAVPVAHDQNIERPS